MSSDSFFLTPIDRLNACVSASVFDISNENISDPSCYWVVGVYVPASIVNGTSGPSACAIPIAIAVLPRLVVLMVRWWCWDLVLDQAKNDTAAAISWYRYIEPFRAFACPTIPCEVACGSSASSSPSVRVCECAPLIILVVYEYTCLFESSGFFCLCGCDCGNVCSLLVIVIKVDARSSWTFCNAYLVWHIVTVWQLACLLVASSVWIVVDSSDSRPSIGRD